MLERPSASDYSPQRYAIVERLGVMVPMSDGVRLSVDIYSPQSLEKLPGILSITPYGNHGDFFRNDARWYAARGYAFVMADCRGRYDSDGIWNPFDLKHKSDGYDLVEWIARQPWSNGKVGMIGLSYQATNQWWTASASPPHLAAIVPTGAAPDRFHNTPYQNGVLSGWFMQWCAVMSGRTNQPFKPRDRKELSEVLKHTPYIDINSFLGMESAPWFRDIYGQNKSTDPYWKLSYQRPEIYSKINVPSLSFSGWFDVAHPGTPMNYIGMRKFGATPTARRPRMIIGPWAHHINTRVVSGTDYGADATIDVKGYTTRWLDHFLKDAENGVENDPPVYVFVMGENRWHAEQDWPLPQTMPTRYYLSSGGRANSLAGDGQLITHFSDSEGFDSYVYDPRSPTLDPFSEYEDHGALDTRSSASGNEVLVYRTAPLTAPTEVTGPIEATLYAATSAQDTDWMVRLVDVYPDGRSLLLAEGVIRARNRDPDDEGRFNAAHLSTIIPAMVYQYTITFWRGTANLFQVGHRIGIEISSSWYPYYIPNLNTGTDNLAMAQLSEAVVAYQTVYHGGRYASHILLPVIPPRSNQK